MNVPKPSVGAINVLKIALATEAHHYVRAAGNRDFAHETAQDEAKDWIRAVESALREDQA